MISLRLVPQIVRAFHLGRQQWVWAQMATPTLDIAAMPNWPDLLAVACREAEGHMPHDRWPRGGPLAWGALTRERAFSQAN